jgi:hypothetical protein
LKYFKITLWREVKIVDSNKFFTKDFLYKATKEKSKTSDIIKKRKMLNNAPGTMVKHIKIENLS